ncbi:hypothetical protein [Photobacterium leiognathi]|uniref:hypothetical protein n=1 Tax=Photobacterium leiognathi TaxID=553611 RepID=UPI0027341745|nr:hypothetical protein [Photobacterium leiognathi]
MSALGLKCSDHRDIDALYAHPLPNYQLDPQVTSHLANKKNNKSIVQYKKHILGGNVIVDIAQQPVNSLLAGLPKNSWIQIIEGNNVALFTGNRKGSPNEIFSRHYRK